MFKRLLTVVLSVLAIAAFSGSVFAQDTANVYVIHGIPGADLGAAPALPVDISVSGACALKNFKFGDIAGPIALPAGKITVQISLADKGNPCGGAVAIGPANFTLSAGENASIIAYLTGEGKPNARKYTNDATKTTGGRARVTVHHTAAAPLVDVSISPKIQLNQFKNAERFTFEAKKSTVQVAIAPAGQSAPAFGPISLDVEGSTRYLVYAVGSVTNNTFTLLLKTY
jgi:hypothetical protein